MKKGIIYVKAGVNLLVTLILLLIVVLLLPKLLWFFAPFVVGYVISLIAGPMVRFLEKKIKLKRKAGGAFVIIFVIALVVFLAYVIIAELVQQGLGFVQDLPKMWQGIETDFKIWSKNMGDVYSKFPLDVQNTLSGIGDNLGKYMGEWVGKVSTPTIEAVGNFAMKLPNMIISVIMCLLSAYFFVADRDSVQEGLKKCTPKSVQDRWNMIRHALVVSVGGYFKAQLTIEIWIYLLLVIGFSILKVKYALLIALGIAFLDFFPVFGTGTVMVPWAIIQVIGGDYKMAIWLLVIWGVSQLVRQFIQPKIVGDSVGLPTLPTLFLLYIGYKFSGVLGMLIAVPVGLIVYTLYEEGAFDTTKNSIKILCEWLNAFRKLEPEDGKQDEKHSN